MEQLNNQLSLIQLSPAAVNRVQEFLARPENAAKFFRFSVKAGGCSGFEYNFDFSSKTDHDVVVSTGGIDVLVDANSIPLIQDATIDFINDFKGTGFIVVNPNSKGTCGCGVSFTV